MINGTDWHLTVAYVIYIYITCKKVAKEALKSQERKELSLSSSSEDLHHEVKQGN